jgi:hypothetical protein
MTNHRWYEAGAFVAVENRSKGRWPIRIITEGKGSSAVYTREMLEANKDVFANRPMFGNHPKDPSKPWERSPFEIKAMLGPVIEGKEVDGVYGLYGEAIVDDEVDAFLEKFGHVTQVSIFASGDGYEKDGEMYAESFDGLDPYTSVDFVVAAGRGGKVEKRVLEHFQSLENGTAPAGAEQERENRMDEAMKAFFEAMEVRLGEKFAALETKIAEATALVESVRDAQPERVEAADAAGELATAVAEAHLGESAVKRVLGAFKDGKSIADAIQHEKDIRDEVLREAGRYTEGYFGSDKNADDDYKVTGLRFN